MSGFDRNPFADHDANPFADPSVTQLTQNAAKNSQKGLEDYNPFADQGTGRNNAGVSQVRGAANPPPPHNPQYHSQMTSGGMGGGQPAVMQPTSEPPPPSYSSQPRISTEELQRRQEELERKAADLQRREEELRNATFQPRPNNWPPLPDNFCVQPCFYQDINVDIPLEFQKTVRTMYYLWMLDASVMILNILGALALLIGTGEGSVFIMSIIFCVVFTPFSYVCWFRPIYKAFRSDSSFNFMVFFFVFFFNCFLKALFAMGVPGMGACGWFVTLDAYGKSIGAAVCSTLVSLGFTAVAAANVYMLLKIHKMYRTSGASFAKAQQEFTTGVMRNEHVQSAAANVAAGAVRQTMATNMGNRY